MADQGEHSPLPYFEKPERTTTGSGIDLEPLYGPSHLAGVDYGRDLADAGTFPFTRGIHADMYRGRMWTRREVCGFGTPAETNERLRFQMKEGVGGLNVIVDMPTRFGIDPDHPFAEGEVGASGAPLFTIEDMRALTDGIPIGEVSFSLISSSCAASVVLAQYLLVARERGIDPARLRGTIQNDPLQTRFCGMGRMTPPDLGLKMAVDIIEYGTRHMPLWNTINVNLYDLRETGITAPQEVAFGFGNAIAYVEGALARGLGVDEFAPRIAFYCSAHIDFLEEIAKLRAARRLWARIMKERFGAKDPRSMKLRFGVHTAGCSLVAQQPLNNVVRVAIETLAAALAGAQSIHCCSYDEPIALPTEQAQRIALRTQQIVAYESNVTGTADPLGGAFAIEALTNRIEEEARAILAEIDSMGGMIEATRRGWVDREIEKAALARQVEIENGRRTVVGVNAFRTDGDEPTPWGVHRFSPESEKRMVEAVARVKRERDRQAHRAAIGRLGEAASRGASVNLVPWILGAVEARATIEEILGTIRLAFGHPYDPFGVRPAPSA